MSTQVSWIRPAAPVRAARERMNVLRAPLLHFLLLGSFLFLLHQWLATPKRDTITVTERTLAGLVQMRSELLGRPLTGDEREELLKRHIEEEVLVREALRRGFDRGDPRIRERLLEKMNMVLREDLPEPSFAELEVFFAARRSRYALPQMVTFNHVFIDASPETTELSAPTFLAALKNGADFEAMGDDFWLGSTLRRYSKNTLAQVLGSEFAERVFALDVGHWEGPIESARGTHYVRLLSKEDPYVPALKEVLPIVRENWHATRQRELQEARIAPLRGQYRIEMVDAKE